MRIRLRWLQWYRERRAARRAERAQIAAARMRLAAMLLMLRNSDRVTDDMEAFQRAMLASMRALRGERGTSDEHGTHDGHDPVEEGWM